VVVILKEGAQTEALSEVAVLKVVILGGAIPKELEQEYSRRKCARKKCSRN
jgi:hypothetical protein